MLGSHVSKLYTGIGDNGLHVEYTTNLFDRRNGLLCIVSPYVVLKNNNVTYVSICHLNIFLRW